MLKVIPWLLVTSSLVVIPTYLHAMTEVVVNLNVKHSVEGKSEFERKNHIKLHSTLNDNDWQGEEDKLKYMMEELDVYFGRDNGGTVWNFNQANEDSANTGYADPQHIITRGQAERETNWGQNKSAFHQYDGRGDLMVGGQPRAHYIGKTSPCCGGSAWQVNGGDAVGDFLGQYVNEFFRSSGDPVTKGHLAPVYFEVLNEPLYQVTDAPHEFGLEQPIPPIDIFTFHNDVADAFRKHNTHIKIGGFTVAFPIFEQREFARWEERMKLFIDTSGSHMDVYSTHFYDLEDDNRYKGSRLEATLDMIDQYSLLALGETKPHVISEYGGRNRPMENAPWSALRDWWFLKTASPMLMQFLSRPDSVLTSIPFVPIKALWGTAADGTPYNWRLLRQQKEAPNETGEGWVFTEMVKFYQLWSDVKGTRVDTFSTNSDFLIDSYVQNDKAYVLISNLTEHAETIIVHKYGVPASSQPTTRIKHLYLKGTAPALDETRSATDTNEVIIAAEATMVIEYDYPSDIVINETSEEKKYFATEYLKPISANQISRFNINSVATSALGEGILRVVVGRKLGKSLAPTIAVNGETLTASAQISGDIQNTRGDFFGVIEFPVPIDLLRTNNEIDVTFGDDGGHIASVNLKVFSFTSDVRPSAGPVKGITIEPTSAVVAVGSTLQLNPTITPYFATNQNYFLQSSAPEVATVTQTGLVSALMQGEARITATTEEGSFIAQVDIEVELPSPTSITFDDQSMYASTVYTAGEAMHVTTEYDAGTGHTVTAALGGVEYRLRHLTASFGLISDVAIVQDGHAVNTQRGTSSVELALPANLQASADLPDGEFYFLFVRVVSSNGETQSTSAFPVSIEAGNIDTSPSLTLDDARKYRDTIYKTDQQLTVTAHYQAGDGNTVTSEQGGVRFYLRELDANFGLINDIIIEDASAIGQQVGAATATFSLAELTPSAALPAGHFYYLFAVFNSTNGDKYNIPGVFPIRIEQEVSELSLTFSEPNLYRSTDYEVGGSLVVSVDFDMGTGNAVSDELGGIRFFLRHLREDYSMVKDIILEDANAIGQQSGSASVTFSLANIAASDALPANDFYFLYVLVKSTDGATQDLAVQRINIVSPALVGDYDLDGDVDINDIQSLIVAIQMRQSIDLSFDMNSDGTVNLLDTRLLMNACTRTRCAP